MRLLAINQGVEHMREAVRRIVFPLPEDQEKQGFEPNFYINFLRKLSGMLISLLRLNGINRFSNEFIQMLDPKMDITLPDNEKITFRTGHGRLVWRAREFLREEPMLIEWIDQFQGDDCFYDIGANVGCFSLYAAKRGVKTFSVEPEYFNLSLLYENIFLNKLQDKCTPLPVAVGDSTQVDVFYLKSISKGDALHCIGRKSYMLDDPSSSEYRLNTLVMKLDDLIEHFNLPKPTRLKIDVDYNELQIIKGAEKTLDNVREIYVELDLKLEEHREVLEVLKKRYFSVVNKESIAREWNNEISNYILRRETA